MTHEGARKATCKAIDLAKENGGLSGRDPKRSDSLDAGAKRCRGDFVNSPMRFVF